MSVSGRRDLQGGGGPVVARSISSAGSSCTPVSALPGSCSRRAASRPLVVGGLADSRQPGGVRGWDVVEADDRELLVDAQAARGRGGEHAERERVTGREDRGRPRARGERLGAAAGDAAGGLVGGQPAPGHTGGGERLAVAGEPLTRVDDGGGGLAAGVGGS